MTGDVEVALLGEGRTRVRHTRTGHVIETDMSPAFGGGGSTFSSTDLVAAALGSCIASSIEGILERAGVGLDRVSMSVTKTLGTEPKRIEQLAVVVSIDAGRSDRLAKTLARGAQTCTVHRSLACEVSVEIAFSS